MALLPSDILFLIWKGVDARSLSINHKRVCKRWNQLLSKDSFWQSYLGTKENPTPKDWQWLAVSKVDVQMWNSLMDSSWITVGCFKTCTSILEGEWMCGRAHGYGTRFNICSNNKVELSYRGEYRYGKFHGYGVKSSAFETYSGQFTDGDYDGYGLTVGPNGTDLFYSERVNTLRVSGFYVWQDGRSYEGALTSRGNLAATGYGVHIWPDGSRYEGNWYEMKRDGRGRMTWYDGTTWEGRWEDDRRLNYNMPLQRWDNFFLHSSSELYQIVKEVMSTN
jgi:MORN repeat